MFYQGGQEDLSRALTGLTAVYVVTEKLGRAGGEMVGNRVVILVSSIPEHYSFLFNKNVLSNFDVPNAMPALRIQ